MLSLIIYPQFVFLLTVGAYCKLLCFMEQSKNFNVNYGMQLAHMITCKACKPPEMEK